MPWDTSTAAVWALRDVTLDLDRGVMVLPGSSGARKTTLWHMLATASPPTQGELSLFGLDPAVPKPADRHPPTSGVPATRGRISPGLQRLRLRRPHRGAEGMDPAGIPHRRRPRSSQSGEPGRLGYKEDSAPLRRPAASPRNGLGPARQSRHSGVGRTDDSVNKSDDWVCPTRRAGSVRRLHLDDCNHLPDNPRWRDRPKGRDPAGQW
jgi:hypothetical protein